jgi:hypothetical protein
MSNEYLRLNDTKMNIQKAGNLLGIIEEKRKDVELVKEIQSEGSLFSVLFKAFKDFFANLGKPTLQRRLIRRESPARSSDYNDTMTELVNDIHVAYTETDSLSSVIIKDFNYSETDRQMLLNKVRKLSSDTTDYSFYSSGAKSQSIFAIDDFIDNYKIDFSKITPGVDAAELVPSQGAITLKRTGNIDRNGFVNSVTGIKESIPVWDPAGERGGYEGLYFGTKNEPRPEGGIWHVTYSPDGTRLYEQGASEDELMPRRLSMFDNNPDTFWEVELDTNPIVGYKDKYSGKQISVAEFNALVANEINSPNANAVASTIVTDKHGSLIEDYVPITSASTTEYLTCSFIVHLSQNEIINWISLNPNNFGQDLYLDVLSIQTSADGKTFSELDGFDDHEYEITLTSKANSELNPLEVKDTLSPDQFKYAGQGVWCFAPRETRVIKFNLRQTRSYLKEYEVLMVEVEQTITTTVTTTKYWGLSKKTSTNSHTVRTAVELPYLTGHIVGFDAMSLEPGGTATDLQKNNLLKKVALALPGLPGVANPTTLGQILFSPVNAVTGGAAFLVALGLSFFSGTTKTQTTVSAAKISRQWTSLKDDRSRFAIGIRDINIFSYKFAEVSELVSTLFSSPKPISKIALQVDETIPKIFYEDPSRINTENDWIKYYISVDNGTSWNRISPMSHRTTFTEDGKNTVPEIININSDIPVAERKNPLAYIDLVESVYSVRFKAALSRPTDIEDAESYTPVLSKYALQIYPMGGL